MTLSPFHSLLLTAVVLVSVILLPACSTEKIEHVANPSGVSFVDAGSVLVRGLGSCGYCHGTEPKPGAPLSGGQIYRDLYGEREVPNITASAEGIGPWSAENFISYFRHGQNKDGELLSQIPHRGMEWMSDHDLLSILAYLKSLPPVKREGEHSYVLSFLDRNTSGFWEGRREVTGFVPEIAKRTDARFGQYLVNNVAGCARCHNAPDNTFSSGEYLGGGQDIHHEAGEKIAANITNSEADGIGDWSENEIVSYLQSGERPSGKKVDTRFCPIEFYRNAPEADLRSIALYLKTVSPE